MHEMFLPVASCIKPNFYDILNIKKKVYYFLLILMWNLVIIKCEIQAMYRLSSAHCLSPLLCLMTWIGLTQQRSEVLGV